MNGLCQDDAHYFNYTIIFSPFSSLWFRAKGLYFSPVGVEKKTHTTILLFVSTKLQVNVRLVKCNRVNQGKSAFFLDELFGDLRVGAIYLSCNPG
jgi:hypothetical protein